MTYFKKVGRLTQEEQAVINVIENTIAEKQIPLSEIPECKNLDDLLEVKLLLDAYQSVDKTDNQDVDIQETIELQEAEIIEESTQTDSGSAYTENEEDNSVETNIENAEHTLVEEKEEEPEFISNDYNPFEEEIIERSYNVNEQNKELDSDKSNSLEEDKDVILEEAKETPIDEAKTDTRKKVAEQTADALLKGYAKIIPQPFKWLAKIDEQKVERLAFEGQIDITIEVSEAGMTFDDYMKQTNEQVDEVFEVESETLEDIREPLIEVLMEQELELTPQQRLAMAVVSHIAQMLMTALKLRKQNNRILEFQKKLTQLANLKVAS